MRIASIVLVLATLPSCSLLFDGSNYRSPAGGDAGGACTVASCGLGQRCNMATGACASGCDQDEDCSDLEVCDFTTNTCEPDSGCVDDTDCRLTEYCDELGACIPCDADSDGWAPVGASARCVAGMVVGINDCAPGDATIHPLSLPDCLPTNDTCEAETHLGGLLASNGFEVGATALTDATAPAELLPGSLRVHVLGATMTETTVLVLAQRADGSHAPVFQVVQLRQEDLPGAPLLSPLATWDTSDVSEFAMASMSLGSNGVEIVVVERTMSGGRYHFVHVDPTGSVVPRAPQELDLGTVVPLAINQVVMGRSGTAPPIALVELTLETGPAHLQISASMQRTTMESIPSDALPIALDGRSFAAAPLPGTGLWVWNGNEVVSSDTLSIPAVARYGFASSPNGRTLVIGIDGSTVRTVVGTCSAADTGLSSCLASATGTIGFGMAVATEPLISIDWASGTVFGIAARLPMGNGLLFTLAGTTPVAPYGDGALVFPVPSATRPFVASGTDADLGIATASAGSAARITAGYGFASGTTVRLMAVQLCVDALP